MTPQTPREEPAQVSLTKRTLLKAGWVTPVILAVGLPASSYAQNVSRREARQAEREERREERQQEREQRRLERQ
jgi:hypothetical protein